MIRPFRLALLVGFAISAMTVHAQTCTVECNTGEAYHDAAALCMLIVGVSS